jgi:hypothetical protein
VVFETRGTRPHTEIALRLFQQYEDLLKGIVCFVSIPAMKLPIELSKEWAFRWGPRFNDIRHAPHPGVILRRVVPAGCQRWGRSQDLFDLGAQQRGWR